MWWTSWAPHINISSIREDECLLGSQTFATLFPTLTPTLSAALFYQAFCMNRDECGELFLLLCRTYWKQQFMNNAAFTSAYNTSTKWWLYFKPSAFRTGQRKHKTLHCVPKQLKIHILAKRTFKKLCCICLVWYNKYQPSIEKTGIKERRSFFLGKTNPLPPPIRIYSTSEKIIAKVRLVAIDRNRHTYRCWFKNTGLNNS